MDEFVGRRVFHLMWDRHLTQTAFGHMIGQSQSNLAKKLRGTRGWSLDDLKAAAKALDTTMAYLVGESEEPGKPHNSPKLPTSDYKVALSRGPRPVVALHMRGPRSA